MATQEDTVGDLIATGLEVELDITGDNRRAVAIERLISASGEIGVEGVLWILRDAAAGAADANETDGGRRARQVAELLTKAAQLLGEV